MQDVFQLVPAFKELTVRLRHPKKRCIKKSFGCREKGQLMKAVAVKKVFLTGGVI